MLNEEMIHHLRARTRLVYVITDEEDRFIQDFKVSMSKRLSSTWVFNPTFGLRLITNYTDDWSTRNHTTDPATMGINEALIQIYKDTVDQENFYLILDAERWFRDDHAIRRTLNVIHHANNDANITKCLIFIGSRKVIPEKLSRYFQVVNHAKGLNNEEITSLVSTICTRLGVQVPKDEAKLFKGMTSFEIESSIFQSLVRTRKSKIDSVHIAEYRRDQLKKTDLLQLCDTTGYSFDSIGGTDRLKEWVSSTTPCWSEEGQKFGLEPPRGLLFVGVYGCGKSLSVKATAREWGLPLVQLEMGKLRSSGVGDSEGNLYKALRIVDSISPCILQIDEAEKSLSGGASSAQSDAGTTSRLLGILSTWTQETKSQVCIIMTANSLQNLPPEMVNRMDERFFFDVPDETARIDIIKIHAKQVNQDVSSFNLADLGERSRLLVGREIQQAIKAAMVRSFNKKYSGLNEEILAEELHKKPRIVKTMIDEIQAIITWVGYDPELGDGIRAKLASSYHAGSFKTV